MVDCLGWCGCDMSSVRHCGMCTNDCLDIDGDVLFDLGYGRLVHGVGPNKTTCQYY